MNEFEKNKIQSNLAGHLQEYISAIIEKYGKYIPKEKLATLNNINNFESLIKIYDYGSVNAYANDNEIYMPLCADRLLKIASKIPGYGIFKKHKSYNQETLLNNNNTYIKYIFSGGASALKEGINELLTRKLALEKGFKTSGCGYPKEVQLAFQLQNIFGEEILDQIAFINSDQDIYTFLLNTLGLDAAELYIKISQKMEQEFHKKYYANMDSYGGLTGILKKTINYHKIDYSSVYKILKDYNLSRQTAGQHGRK